MDLSKKQKKPINKFKKKKKFKWTRAKTFVVVIIVAFLGIVGAAVSNVNEEEEALDKIQMEGEYSEEVQQAMEDYENVVKEEEFKSRVQGYEENISNITPCLEAFDSLKSYTLVTTEYEDEEELPSVGIYQHDKDKGIIVYTLTERTGDAYYNVLSQIVTDLNINKTYVLTQNELYAEDSTKRKHNADLLSHLYRQLIEACAFVGYNDKTLTFNGAVEDFSFNSSLNLLQDYNSSLLRMACNKYKLPTSLSVYNLEGKSEILYNLIDIDETYVEKPDWCVDLDKK